MLDPEAGVPVAAGPITMVLERGELRAIHASGREVLTGIHAAVRDASWRTIAPRFDRYELVSDGSSFSARIGARCEPDDDGAVLVWTSTIEGRPDGTLSFVFDVRTLRPFVRSRIGLCVLHPRRLAGSPIIVDTPWGRLRGAFPKLITANLPFSNITSLRQEVGRATELEVRFEGDLFQMEDQRAFIDPSFKAFSTPLELPRPVELESGVRIHQEVHVRLVHGPSPTPGRRSATRAIAEDTVQIGAATRDRPLIGSEIPPPEVGLPPGIVEGLRQVRLDFVRLVASADNVREGIERGARIADELGVPLALAMVTSAQANPVPAVEAITSAGVRIERLAVYDGSRHTTPPAVLTRWRAAIERHGGRLLLGGGSRAYLYQLVLDGVPEGVDFVEFAINPQVHATDASSIRATVEGLGDAAASAARLGLGVPVHVAPATLRALVNPDLAGPDRGPGPDGLPATYDRRQVALLTAAWTLGSYAALADSGVASVSFHELAGWGGLVAAAHDGLPPMPWASGSPLPVGVALSSITGVGGARVCEVAGSPSTRALALEHRHGVRILLVSSARERREVIVRLPIRPERVEAVRLDDDASWRAVRLVKVSPKAFRVGVELSGVTRIDVR